jgi:hypothetical protein
MAFKIQWWYEEYCSESDLEFTMSAYWWFTLINQNLLYVLGIEQISALQQLKN